MAYVLGVVHPPHQSQREDVLAVVLESPVCHPIDDELAPVDHFRQYQGATLDH